MLGRRIDLRSAIDGLLLAVPCVLLLFVTSRHVLRIGLQAGFIPRVGSDGLELGTVMFLALYAACLIAGFSVMHFTQPPLRVTPARLLLILFVTLVTIALAAVDMAFVEF